MTSASKEAAFAKACRRSKAAFHRSFDSMRGCAPGVEGSGAARVAALGVSSAILRMMGLGAGVVGVAGAVCSLSRAATSALVGRPRLRLSGIGSDVATGVSGVGAAGAVVSIRCVPSDGPDRARSTIGFEDLVLWMSTWSTPLHT